MKEGFALASSETKLKGTFGGGSGASPAPTPALALGGFKSLRPGGVRVFLMGVAGTEGFCFSSSSSF